MLNLILAVLLGVIAGTATFGVAAAAFAGASFPLAAAAVIALATTVVVGLKLRPGGAAA